MTDNLDVNQLTAPMLFPFGTDWQLVIYSMAVGFLIALLISGGIAIVWGSMKTRRAQRDPVSESGVQLKQPQKITTRNKKGSPKQAA